MAKDLTEERYFFWETVEKESDRGLALVCGEHANAALADLIRRALVDSSLVKAALDKPGGLLWEFDARIKAAYLFGLIQKVALHRLEGLQIVRNQAGHTRNAFDLARPSPKVQVGLDKLPRYDRTVETDADLMRDGLVVHVRITDNPPKDSSTADRNLNRWRLLATATGLAWYLDDVRRKLEAVAGLKAGELPLLLHGQRARFEEQLDKARRERAAAHRDRIEKAIFDGVDPPAEEQAAAPEPEAELPAANTDPDPNE